MWVVNDKNALAGQKWDSTVQWTQSISKVYSIKEQNTAEGHHKKETLL